jgi:hypothetical protein
MRITRDQFSLNGFYHLYNHTPSNALLFRDDHDYQTCISLLGRYIRQNTSLSRPIA